MRSDALSEMRLAGVAISRGVGLLLHVVAMIGQRCFEWRQQRLHRLSRISRDCSTMGRPMTAAFISEMAPQTLLAPSANAEEFSEA